MHSEAHYEFPIVSHLDQLRDAIAGHDQFVIAEREGYVTVDYIYAGPAEMFGCLLTMTGEERRKAILRRECRGIKFDEQGRIIARPYHKFFNFGEKPETQSDRIDLSRPHRALKKLDGSMIHSAPVDGRDRLMTTMGLTRVAAQAEEFAFERSGLPYAEMCRDMRADGITPIMEWCSRKNQIVVHYPVDRLVLTGLRSIATGQYVPYEDMARIAAAYRIPVVEALGSDVEDLDAFVAFVRALPDEEGFVIRFDDGRMLKFKAEAYLRMHKTKDGLMREKDVLRMVIAGAEDDVKPLLPAHDREALEAYAAAVRQGLARTAADLDARVAEARIRFGGDRKRFATEFVPTLHRLLREPAYKIYGGRPALEALIEYAFYWKVKGRMELHIHSQTDVDELRWLWGGADWRDLFSFGDNREAAA